LDVSKKLLGVFTDDGFSVIAGDIVPLGAILVDVVEDSQAGFGRVVDGELCVVGLRGFEVTGVAPRLFDPAWWGRVGRRQLDVGSGPEPAEDLQRFQVFARLAALEVAHAAASPDVGQFFSFDDGFDHFVFQFGLDTDGIHAVFAAQVSGVEPVELLTLVLIDVLAQEIEVSSEFPLFGSSGAGESVGFDQQTAAIVDGTGGGCGRCGRGRVLVVFVVFVGTVLSMGDSVGSVLTVGSMISMGSVLTVISVLTVVFVMVVVIVTVAAE